MTKRICRGPHPLLILENATEMGGFVKCLQCGDSFHASQRALEETYYHAVNLEPGELERDFFIHGELVDRWFPSVFST